MAIVKGQSREMLGDGRMIEGVAGVGFSGGSTVGSDFLEMGS